MTKEVNSQGTREGAQPDVPPQGGPLGTWPTAPETDHLKTLTHAGIPSPYSIVQRRIFQWSKLEESYKGNYTNDEGPLFSTAFPSWGKGEALWLMS